MGPSINEVSHLRGGRGICRKVMLRCYSISLFSKIGDKWGQKSQKMGDVIWTAAIEKSRQNNIFLLFHSDFYERKNYLGILSILLFTRHKLLKKKAFCPPAISNEGTKTCLYVGR